MSLERVEASVLGIENIGQLQFDSAWQIPGSSQMDELEHSVDTKTIFVNPEHVLYWHHLWGRDSDGLNSSKRFSHMLSLRAVPMLGSLGEYEQSLNNALDSSGIVPPQEKRQLSLLKQVDRYIKITKGGERVSRVATSTVRILFRYNPPLGESLEVLNEHLLGK